MYFDNDHIHVLSYHIFMQTIIIRMHNCMYSQCKTQNREPNRYCSSVYTNTCTLLLINYYKNGTSSIGFSHNIIWKNTTNLAHHVIKASTGWFLVLEASRMISTSKLQCIHPIGGSGTDLHDNSSRLLDQMLPAQKLTLEYPCFAYWQTILLFHNVCYSCSALDLTMLTSSNNIDMATTCS